MDRWYIFLLNTQFSAAPSSEMKVHPQHCTAFVVEDWETRNEGKEQVRGDKD